MRHLAKEAGDKRMTFDDAVQKCHVRSGIRMESEPDLIFWKNHPIPLHVRIPKKDQSKTDWEEYDPRDQPECSAFNEMPA